MEALLTSFGLVTLAEIGDKTQLLAMVLALRFRQPLAIIAGILAATLLNHFLAALLGTIAADLLSSGWFRIATGIAFLAMGAWALIPDRFEEGATRLRRGSAFAVTAIAFFLVEMGDKTQMATIALGARFDAVVAVTIGTTLGMMAANAPVVLLGDRLLNRVNFGVVRKVAAALFVAIGLWTLFLAVR